ncbi:AaceriACR214Cp [[Ashbya] aceris (nom. inval.)]|nr:AaceriACR214Cp [[Ashbya] aceris (nom. inval.)]
MNKEQLQIGTCRNNSAGVGGGGGGHDHTSAIKLPPLTNHHMQQFSEVTNGQGFPGRPVISSPSGQTQQFGSGTIAPQAISGASVSSATPQDSFEGSNSYKLPKYARTTWKPHEDISLLRILLNSKQQLSDPQFISSPRRKFWQWISDQLYRESHISRNTRQCRDRFNLLYKKTSKRFATQPPPPPQDELEKLLKMLLESFAFNPEGNIILCEQRAPSSASSSSSSTVVMAPSSQNQFSQDGQVISFSSYQQCSGNNSQSSASAPGSGMNEPLVQIIHNLSAEVSSLRQEVTQIKQLLTRKSCSDSSPSIPNW